MGINNIKIEWEEKIYNFDMCHYELVYQIEQTIFIPSYLRKIILITDEQKYQKNMED